MFYFSSLKQVMDAGNHFKNRASKAGKPIFDPKRGLLLALCIIAINCTCFGQDIIVTKDARRINAKVTEVNVDNVRYKNFDNQDGPVYTLLKSDIASIIYQNGNVETFASESQKTTPPSQTQTPIKQTPYVTPTLWHMEEYHPDLYSKYKGGRTLSNIGWFFAICGPLVLTFDKDIITGVTFAVAGVGIGVPCIISGNKAKNRALDEYLRQFNAINPATPHFQINVYPNRVGLAYVF